MHHADMHEADGATDCHLMDALSHVQPVRRRLPRTPPHRETVVLPRLRNEMAWY